MITQGFYTADWRQVWEQHHANMMVTLKRRIQTAKANNDRRLLALLTQEQEALTHPQLSTTAPLQFSPSHDQSGGKDWGALFRALFQDQAHVSVEQITSPAGQAWRLHDPRTGQSRYAQSAAEVMEWIEANHLGD